MRNTRRDTGRAARRVGGQRLSLERLEPRCVLSAASLVISEFMASNASTLADGDGAYSDWIEVHNQEDFAVDLSDYFLTDDEENLTRWPFPQTTLAAGGHLVVFASSPLDDQNNPLDDYVDDGGYLHTNFNLAADGEYLAIAYQDPTTEMVSVVHEYADKYPAQRADVSYGVGQIADQQHFVAAGATAHSIVPTDDSLEGVWNLPGYAPDSGWVVGATGVGFGQAVDGFLVRGYQANTSAGSPIGATLDNLAEVMEVINNPAAQAGSAEGNYATINFFNTGDSGHYGGDAEFPGQTNPTNYNHFVTEARAYVSIPEPGQYTFGVYSNEGFLLQVGGFELYRDGPGNSGSNELATFNFAEAGDYELSLHHFERTGDAWIELFAAPGEHQSWNATDFDLVGDVANGGLAVRSDAVGGEGAGIGRLLGTDLEDAMLGVNASLYTRIGFNAAEPGALDKLLLRMKRDDGFVAYLNGVEIARRNVTGAVAWDSTADGPRGAGDALVYEEIDVSAFLPLLAVGQNVLAIQGLNASAVDPDALVLPELIGYESLTEGPAYFDAPTPGAANGSGHFDFVGDTAFSVDRGFYDAPFQLEITSDTAGAQIYYTTNGEAPTPSTGTLYQGPLTIDHTTVLRAVAHHEGYLPTNVDTQTYLFLNDILQQDYQAALAAGFPSQWGGYSADYGLDPDVVGQFGNDGQPIGGDDYGGQYAALLKDGLGSLPTISIVADVDDLFGANGIYTNSTAHGSAWERAASVEWITADGSQEFQLNAGLRIQGGFFRSNNASAKHSFRLLFKSEYGDSKLDYPLFEGAADSYNTLVLRAGGNDGYSWSGARYTEQFIRDEFGRGLQNAAGRPSAHGNFAHLYINGVYWGLYNPVERPDAEFAASYFGGEADNWDSIHVAEVSTGDRVAWDDMLDKTLEARSSLAAYMELQGLDPDGAPNGVAPLLNVESYIDYIAINVWGGNWDWPWKNWWAGRDRADATTTGFEFFNWDFENTMGNNRSRSPLGATTLDQDFTGSDNAGQAHDNLRQNPEYRLAFADHAHKLFFNDGLLTPDSLIERYQALADGVELVIVGESARWGDMHHSTPLTQGDWLTERDWVLNDYLPYRSDIVLQELRNYDLYPDIVAPVFSQHGGDIPDGFQLAITARNGAVWYTLDGSDPRLVGGAINPDALQYTGAPIELSPGVTVRARVLNGEWSALNEADFIAEPGDASALRITELHYHPAQAEEHEFIEVTNTGAGLVSLAGVQIAGFASEPYVFAAGLTLGAGERIVVARNPADFEAHYGTGFNLAPAGYADANLGNGGEAVSLLAPGGQLLQHFEYDDADPWPATADGAGPSLEYVGPFDQDAADPLQTAGDPYDAPSYWRASPQAGGTPGFAPTRLAGDYDYSGVVDADDYAVWRAGYGASPLIVGTGADGNLDGVIDAADYSVWRDNVGASLPAALAVAPPAIEPQETAAAAPVVYTFRVSKLNFNDSDPLANRLPKFSFEPTRVLYSFYDASPASRSGEGRVTESAALPAPTGGEKDRNAKVARLCLFARLGGETDDATQHDLSETPEQVEAEAPPHAIEGDPFATWGEG